MIIDIHCHPKPPGPDVEAAVADLDAHDVDQAWIFGWQCPPDELDHALAAEFPEEGPIPWEPARRLYKRRPDRFVFGYAPDFRRPEALDLMKSGIDNYNVRVCAEVKIRDTYDGPDAERVFRLCGEKRVPVLLHYAYETFTGRHTPRASWWYGGDLFSLERVLRRCPDTNFIAGGPGFWRHFSRDERQLRSPYEDENAPGIHIAELLDACPNLFCDTSGEGLRALRSDGAGAAELFLSFPDRMLFGRDGTGGDLMQFVDGLSLPEAMRESYYSKNALRLLGE